MQLVAIAGGSGAGKSSISYSLQDNDPDNVEVINFDDYQKLTGDENLPRLDGMKNWDHPDAIRWDQLEKDIKDLKHGKSITINSWAHRSNPDYHKHRKMIKRTIRPKPIVIVEGYLVLHDPQINQLFDKKVYLDLDDETRNQRRDKGVLVTDSKYIDKVLKPMYEKYVKPSKNNADFIIDVSDKTVGEVAVDVQKSVA